MKKEKYDEELLKDFIEWIQYGGDISDIFEIIDDSNGVIERYLYSRD